MTCCMIAVFVLPIDESAQSAGESGGLGGRHGLLPRVQAGGPPEPLGPLCVEQQEEHAGHQVRSVP